MQRRGLNIRKTFLKFLFPLLRRMDPAAATRFVAGIGHTEYRFARTLRVRFDQAVSRNGAYLGRPWDVPRVSRALAGNQIRWRTRDQLLDHLDAAAVARLFRVHGLEHLEAARAQGKGVLLLGNHYGAHLMPAHWLVRNQVPLRLFMERPNRVSKVLSREFDTDGPLGQKKLFISRKADATEAAASIMRAARVLKSGLCVLIASDVRWTGSQTAVARFLGHEYSFSATWVTLAALTRAPVVPVFCTMAEDGTHDLEFLPAFEVPADGKAPEQLGAWVQRALDQIEQRVASDPTNSNEYFFWAEPDDPAHRHGARASAALGPDRDRASGAA